MDSRTRERIGDFLAAYGHAIDDDALESWPDFFTEDALYQITTRENLEADRPLGVMLCEGRGMMADRIKALRSANIYEPHTYCHILGPTSFGDDSDGTVAARTNFHVVRTMQNGRMETFAAGKYLDRIDISGAAPLLAERRVVLESRRVDILLVFPL